MYLRSRIQTILIKATRIVLGKGSARLSTTKILKILGWQGIDQLMAIHSLRLAVKTILTGTPTNLNARINKIPAKETRAKTRGDRIQPSWCTARGRQSFTNRAVKSINAMPKDMLIKKNKKVRG